MAFAAPAGVVRRARCAEPGRGRAGAAAVRSAYRGRVGRYRGCSVSGRFQYRSGAHSQVWLSRIPGTPADIVATEALPITPLWRDIRITEHSRFGRTAGETIQLQATLYRTTLPGRQPLIVFNHGGGDKDRPGVPTVFRAEDIARVFLARGYNVIVPMRKGRGLSGGPDVEDFDTTPHIQAESAVEDLDAVVDHMAAQPWVDPARIIVAGWSRGGFLSLIYAARFPLKVAGVINFAGCWTPELGGTNAAEFNRTQMAEAGRHGDGADVVAVRRQRSLLVTAVDAEDFRRVPGKRRPRQPGRVHRHSERWPCVAALDQQMAQHGRGVSGATGAPLMCHPLLGCTAMKNRRSPAHC